MNDFLVGVIIADIIIEHEDFSNAINQHEIAEEFNHRAEVENFIKPRKVRKIIEELIKNGSPIISSPQNPGGGYAWEGGPGEALECYKRLRRKGIKILLRARRILRNSKRGQGVLF